MENSLVVRDQQVIWHPYTPQKYAPAPIGVSKGEGVHIIDTNGKRYIDCISSWWVTIHGHGHPYIAKKIYEQALNLEQIIFAGFTHEPAVKLAERLLPLLPGSFSKIFYSDNGSTAVEVAIKMALQFWWNQGAYNRKKVIALRNAYHGDTFGAMSVSGRSIFTAAFETFMFEVVYLELPDLNSEEANIKIIDSIAEDAACFIYEPMLQGAGGMQMYSSTALDNLISYAKSKNIICIADEVLTGFGRTGKLFAGEYLQETSDIICLSKGLTGGTMALGVTACTEKIHHAFVTDDRYKTFFHGHSFTANPIACAASLASLDLLLSPDCADQLAMIVAIQAQFASELMKADTGSLVSNVRHLGTIIAFEIGNGDQHYLKTSGRALADKALEKGIFIRPLGNTVYLMPPYCITKSELTGVQQVILQLVKEQSTSAV